MLGRALIIASKSGINKMATCSLKMNRRALLVIQDRLSSGLVGNHKIPEEIVADHSWRQTNHIWSTEELEKIDASKHQPRTFSDRVARSAMNILYHGFNFVTGYDKNDPSTHSVAWRLIILESFAGVPGFIAAAYRHFYSLRALKRDHGTIWTFLEEAENERMHLLVCLKMFEVSLFSRLLVSAAQLIMGPVLTMLYFFHPPTVHRFVGYLEETAVETYGTIIDKANTPGTKLYNAWQGLDAPAIAKSYWKLKDNATWIDTLQHIRADEAHHRDVNHTFADLPSNAENPFIADHIRDFDAAAIRRVQEAMITSPISFKSPSSTSRP
mmetsp:Transcript_20065/g.24331  ORF Transcript_20065/g.24331 Transcript_20065/m.24331 type:complete len:326 (+) Transcript_20065:3-980(+)